VRELSNIIKALTGSKALTGRRNRCVRVAPPEDNAKLFGAFAA
jgi:hypothetical protein